MINPLQETNNTQDSAQHFVVGGFEMELTCNADVMAPSPYSRLIADSIPTLEGGIVVDIGTGSGALAITALSKGATVVYLSDIRQDILDVAEENIKRNVPSATVYSSMASQGSTLPTDLPSRVDLFLCNPASLPLPPREADDRVPYASGENGRRMIEQVIADTSPYLHGGAKLIFAHTSLANFNETQKLLEDHGLQHQVLATMELEFRPFYDRDWINTLGGVSAGLYAERDDKAFEQVRIIEVTSKKLLEQAQQLAPVVSEQ